MDARPVISELKIAYLGGGSREWARKLMIDLALCPELSGQVALYDIDREAAMLNEQLGNWLQDQPGVLSHWKYEVAATLETALHGADFVVISIQPGTLEVMAEEITIAEEYGQFFPVGDTVGAPGLVRGLRSAAIYAEFARALAAICPQAWIINYTNPMTICTRTLTRVEPALKVFGCCHEVYATQRMLAGIVKQYLDIAPTRAEIKVNVLGINHFTWIDRASYQAVDVLHLLRDHLARPGVIRSYTQAEVESWNDWFRSADQVKFALYQRYGSLAAAGDRHLVEFLPGFTRSPEELFRWGVIRTPVAWRIQRWRNAPQKTRDLMAGREPLVLQSTGEEGVAQIKALLGLGELITNVNLPNQGQIANLPLQAVVETNAHFSRDEVRPLASGELPANVQPLIARHVVNQEMTVEAALTRDRDLAFHAIYHDPANGLPLDRAWEMFNRLLHASRDYLPGWSIN